MILKIVQLCFALYSSGDHVTEPFAVTCYDFSTPFLYDVELCPGEVTTPKDDWSHATCEVTIGGEEWYSLNMCEIGEEE